MNQRTVSKVVVNWAHWQDQIPEKAMEAGFGNVSFFVSEDRDQVLAEMADADVALVAGWYAEQLRAGKKLRWVHAVSGGIEGLLFPEFVQSPALFSCGKPTFAIPGAESALAAMLMFTRRNHVAIGQPKTDRLGESRDDELSPVDLAGKTVGILGMGGMGQALAPRAAALGTRVVAATRRRRGSMEGVDRSYTMDRLLEFLETSDFVVVALPVTAETRGMIDDTVFRHMKESAFLIDISGRPTLFDYRALVRAVQERRIAGICTQPAGHHPEIGMPPIDSDFWQMKNVVVTPCRGTSREQVAAGLDLFFDNLRRFEAGQPLLGLVDKQAGY